MTQLEIYKKAADAFNAPDACKMTIGGHFCLHVRSCGARILSSLGMFLWYVAYTAHNIGYPLGKIMAMNQEKLAKWYPDGKFNPEKSQNRKVGDI